MEIDLTLDYQTILRNEPRPVHLVATLCAPKLEAHTRPRSAAFAVVLERSGSVAGGEPLRLGARGADFKFLRQVHPGLKDLIGKNKVGTPTKTTFSNAGNDMRKFKITYVRPHGDSTWLYITVEAPSSSAAKEIAQSMLTGMRILNVTPVS
jgi:hypothetical protein